MSIQISFHESSLIDCDMFHVRLRATTEQVARFLEAVEAVIADDFMDKKLDGHVLKVHDFDRFEGNFWAYGDIGNMFWRVDRQDDGKVIIDFNAYKVGDGDNRLDGTQPQPLPQLFWLEPASIIRAMTGTAA